MAILVYPNPNVGKFYVELNNTPVGSHRVKLYDSLGKLIYKNKLDRDKTKLIELKGAPAGKYIVSVGNDEAEARQQVIVQNQ